MAFLSIFVSVSAFGLQQVLARDIARGGSDPPILFGAGLVGVALAAGPLVGAAAVLDVAVYATHPVTRDLVFVLLPLIPLNALWFVSSAVLIARSRNDLRAVLDILSSAALVVVILVVRATTAGSVTYLLLTVAATGVASITAVAMARRYVVPALRRGAPEAVPLGRRAAAFALGQAAAAAYAQLDTILVALFTTAAAVAWYGVGVQIAGFVAAVPGMLTVATIPHYMRADEARRRALLQRLLDVLLLVGAIVPVLGALFARSLIVTVAGRAFAPGAFPLALLIGASALTFPAALFGEGLILLGLQRRAVQLMLVVLGINVVGNLVAIPLDGITGAALVMIASEAVSWCLGAVYFQKESGYRLSYRSGGMAFLAAAVTAGLYALCNEVAGIRVGHGLAVMLEGVLVIACYLLLLGGGLLIQRQRLTSARIEL